MKYTTSIIIPTYNESAIIEHTLDTLLSALPKLFGRDFELIFVDDGSRDGTADLLAALIAERAKMQPDSPSADGRVLVLCYGENRGKGYAVRYGMLRARGQKRIFTDADLAYGTDVLATVACKLQDTQIPLATAFTTHGSPETAQNPEKTDSTAAPIEKRAPKKKAPVLQRTSKSAPIVIGSRDLHEDGYRGYSPLRRFCSRTYRGLLRVFFGLGVTDSQCGIKGFTATAATCLFEAAACDRYAFDYEILSLAARAGLSVCEIPVCVENNRKSRIRIFRDSFRMLRDVLATRRRLREE